jgi:6-phosphogluconolactonase
MNKSIRLFPTPQALAESLALELINQIKEIKEIKEAGKRISPFTIALSGGSTPKLLFSVLGDEFASSVSWSNVHFFWVDERCVPPDDPESNFGMTNKTLLSKIDIPENNIHRINGEDDLWKEAERYSDEIEKFTVNRNGFPFFNIILLGLGEDGHTASIFPGNEKLFQTDRICASAVHPSTGQERITITGKVINNAANIIFIVTGKNKAGIVNNIVGQRDNKKQFPASFVKPSDGRVFWYLDEPAGSLIGDCNAEG